MLSFVFSNLRRYNYWLLGIKNYVFLLYKILSHPSLAVSKFPIMYNHRRFLSCTHFFFLFFLYLLSQSFSKSLLSKQVLLQLLREHFQMRLLWIWRCSLGRFEILSRVTFASILNHLFSTETFVCAFNTTYRRK